MLAPILVASLLALAPGARPGPAIVFPLDPPEDAAVEPHVPRSAPKAPAGRDQLSSVANVLVNNPTALPAPAADILPAIAVCGNQVVVVWYVRGTLATQRLRVAFSEDGGNTFTDAGWLPNFANWRWGIDPCVDVDPTDCRFLIAAQVSDPAIPATGIGSITVQIIGGSLIWGPVNVTNATGYLGVLYGDQLHTNYDPNNYTWHIAFHDGYVSPAALIHRYSPTHGGLWFQPDTVATDANGNLGYTPRIAYMPNRGPIVAHVNTQNGTWWDPNQLKTSTFQWPNFPSPVPVSTYRIDAGSLPGVIDRVSAQTLAVDRTPHLYQGRAYLAWVQSATLSPTPAPPNYATEFEPNDTPATATLLGYFAGYLNSTLSSGTDADVFSIEVNDGEHVVIQPEYIQSLGPNCNVRVDIIAADGTHSLQFTSFLPGDEGVGRAQFTAPRAGVYYLRFTGFETGIYYFSIVPTIQFPTPARDQRELATSFSVDAGNSWSSPAVLPIGDPGFDVGLPTLVVGNDGRPYLFWLDYSKTDPDGAIATLEVSRSTDGGQTWAEPRTLSTVASDWNPVTVTAGSNQKLGYRIDAATTPIPLEVGPNAARQPGEVTGTPSPSDQVHVVWPDARDGEGNIYSAHFPTGFEVLGQTNDTTVAPGQFVQLQMVLRNRNSVFPELVTPTFLALNRNWSHSYISPFEVEESETQTVYPFSVQVPDSAAPGTVFYQGAILLGSEGVGGCNTFIHVQSNVGVEDALPREIGFAAAVPNPAESRTCFAFALPSPAEVALEVFDIGGARVRSLVSATLPAGPQSRTWDLRDDGGHRIAPGVYLARMTVGTWSRTKRVVVMR